MRKILLILLIWWCPSVVSAEWVPARTDKMVNDYAGLLSESQQQALEHRLEAFSDSTSNQIVVITTTTLDGDEIKAVGQRIGQTWGVGGKDYNNGVIILILSSEQEGNEAAILTGYGLEGALPDIFCKHILDEQMVPHFREGDYYSGIEAALEVILPVTAGEYSYEQYQEDNADAPAWIGLLFFIAIVVILIYFSKNHPEGGGGSYYDDEWTTNHRGPVFTNMGGFGSGMGGSFGGGGFGGFGGGSFGGGGSSSKW